MYTAHLLSDETKLVEFDVNNPDDAAEKARELAGETHAVLWIRNDGK
ncbi:hypothetical protein [Lysinibacter cavernae]